MINSNLPQLVHKLKTEGKLITIETAGVAYIPEMHCDLMSISPKLSNSIPNKAKISARHKYSRLDIAVLQELVNNYEYQLKFVMDSQDDLPEIQETIEKIGGVNPEKVMLMPQARTRDEFLTKSPIVAEFCKQSGFAFSQRLQILLWNNQKGI